MISVTINDQTISVPVGTTVLKAVRMAGFEIPTLCDHPSLKPYGGCRLCVVEVVGLRTLQASCTMPAYDGMVVRTDTEKVRKARTFVLDLLFSERNHYCMYCQKTDGDCELQNAAYSQDMTHWTIQPAWKPYLVDASHPYFVIDHNRCILCRRCVRACGELVGNQTLNIENRGARSLVVADAGAPIGDSSCIRCGTCLQICPTGAIIDRHSAYLGKEAQTEQIERVCMGCSVGCRTKVLVRDNQVVRIEGVWEAPVNSGLMCEYGRFQPVDEDRQRLTTPLIRKDGALQPASWEEAVTYLGARLDGLRGKNGTGIAAAASTRLSAEALHAFQQLFRGLDASLVTSTEENLTSQTAAGGSRVSRLEDLEKADLVITVGEDLFTRHMVAGFKVKRNLHLGTHLVVIDAGENAMKAMATSVLEPGTGKEAGVLKGIMNALVSLGAARGEAPADLEAFTPAAVEAGSSVPAEKLAAAARLLAGAEHPVIVYGLGLAPNSTETMQALAELAALSGAALFNPRGLSNSVTAQFLELDQPLHLNGHQAVFLAVSDDQLTPKLVKAVTDVPFLAVQATYQSELTELADVVLPVETWAETEGHFVNLEGRIQANRQAVTPPAGIASNLGAFQKLAECLNVPITGTLELERIQQNPQAVAL